MHNQGPPSAMRILALLEGTGVSGPAKNVFEFCRLSAGLVSPPKIAVALFVRPADAGAPTQLMQAATAAGLEIFPIHERFPFDLSVLRSLRALMNSFAPDVIETHHVKSHFLVRLCRRKDMCPWIAFHHGYTDEGMRMAIYNQFDRWSLRVPNRIVTVCRAFEQQLLARGAPADRITVVHNAIAPDWLNGNGSSQGPTGNIPAASLTAPRTVLAVGRFSREKRFCDLVAAMGELRRLCPGMPLKLVLLGDGQERRAIEDTVRRLLLQDAVELPGHVRDVRPYFRRAHALAISSASEGSPNVLLEAMAAGLPVVATAVGGVPEIARDGETALLVKPCDPKALATGLQRLLSDPELAARLATTARELIVRHYSPESRARALMSVYHGVRQTPAWLAAR